MQRQKGASKGANAKQNKTKRNEETLWNETGHQKRNIKKWKFR